MQEMTNYISDDCEGLHVAYCFLMRREPRAWERWWGLFFSDQDASGMSPDRDFVISVHAKRPSRGALCRQADVPRREIERTSWGHASLVRASLSLFRHAIRLSMHPPALFCLLSDACVPLRPRHEVHRKLSSLTNGGEFSLLASTKTSGSYPHEQWCILSASAVGCLLQRGNSLLQEAPAFPCPDECFFGWALSKLNLKWLAAKTTYTDWRAGGAHPREFSPHELIRFKEREFTPSSPFCFIRKINLDLPPLFNFAAFYDDSFPAFFPQTLRSNFPVRNSSPMAKSIVFFAGNNGSELQKGEARITDDWLVYLTSKDWVNKHLVLQAVCVYDMHLIYMFSDIYSPGATAIEKLPAMVRELLLFSPLLPLRKTPDGFQAISPEEWTEITSVKDESSAALAISSARESVVSPPFDDRVSATDSSSIGDVDIDDDTDKAEDECGCDVEDQGLPLDDDDFESSDFEAHEKITNIDF